MSLYIQAPASLKEPSFSQWVQVGNLATTTLYNVASEGITIDEINKIIMTYDGNSKQLLTFLFDPAAAPSGGNPLYSSGEYCLNTATVQTFSIGSNGMNRRVTIRGRYKVIQGIGSNGYPNAVFTIYDGNTIKQTIDLSSILNSTSLSADAAISLFGTYLVIIGFDSNSKFYLFLYQGQA